MNLRAAIDRLEELVISSSPIPLTGIKLIRERDLLGDLDKIRLNIPTAIAEAERIIGDGDRLVQQAEAHAKHIVNTAQGRAEQLVSESIVLQRAEQEAAQIRDRALKEREETLRQAQQESDRIRSEIDRYADSVLNDLERRLSESLGVIRDSRTQLDRSTQVQPTGER